MSSYLMPGHYLIIKSVKIMKKSKSTPNRAENQMHVPALPKNLEALPVQEQLDFIIKYCKAVSEYLHPHIAKAKNTPSPVTRRARKKTIHLIYILNEPDFIVPAEWKYCAVFLDRYTTTGIVPDSEGRPCYPINEFDGKLWLIENFIVSKPLEK
jgi:hypothetical protein